LAVVDLIYSLYAAVIDTVPVLVGTTLHDSVCDVSRTAFY